MRGCRIAAADWEAAFARLLLDEGFRARVAAGDEAALRPYDLTADERAMLRDLDPGGLERFAAGLARKRLLRLRGAFPIAFRAIDLDLEPLVARYRAAHPSVPAICAREVRAFGEVAREWARSRERDWLAELIDWEATGHLAWCREAIDAEGAVVGHLRPGPSALPEERAPEPAARGARHRRAPGAWIEPRPYDLPRLAAWYDEDERRRGPPPADLTSRREVVLLRGPRPGPGNRGLALGRPLRALWEALDGQTPTRALAACVAPELGEDALAGMLEHLARLGLVEPVARPARPGLLRRFRPVEVAAAQPPARPPGQRAGWGQPDVLAVGIGLRRPHAALLARERLPGLDVVEVYAEDYASAEDAGWAELARLTELYPIVPHGLELSLGSVAPPEPSRLAGLRRVLEAVDAPFYTEHLAWTRAPEWRPGHLCPIWPTRATLDRVAGRIETIQAALGRPLAIENIAYDLLLPGSGLAEADAIAELVARTGCRLLLDLTNVVVNAHNHRFDAEAFLRRLPLGAVVQFHLVGYTPTDDGSWVDAHAAPTQPDVLALASRALALGARPVVVVVERDRDLPSLPGLLAEVAQIRRALAPGR